MLADTFSLQHFSTNGITVRAAVEGTGPLVIMVHGWPELWYSWRHQIRPVAEAGYKIVAPDVRGYGGSDKPHPIEAYDMIELTADVVGLIDALREEKAILVGHDWGAPICWNTAVLHPERVSAVVGLSVPYFQRGEVSAIELWKQLYEGKFFYQLYFQEEGVAEAEMEADVQTTLRKLYYIASGDPTAEDIQALAIKGPEDNLLDGLSDPDPLPAWLTDEDLYYFVEAFTQSGFRGSLNRYRAQQRDWELLPQLSELTVDQPSYFIAGALDVVRTFIPGVDLFENPGVNCTDFRGASIIDREGHWIQQEAPELVNRALLDFLADIS
jgi:pimeloyl-ACP methyl ester carboxylesterase